MLDGPLTFPRSLLLLLFSHSVVSDSATPRAVALQAPPSMAFPGKNTGVGCHVLLQGIFLTQGWSPCLPHWRHILYHLSHQGSPRILEWVAYPFPEELPNLGIKPESPTLQADSLPVELPPHYVLYIMLNVWNSEMNKTCSLTSIIIL